MINREKFNVGGVLLDQPFKARRLGHFGFDNANMDESIRFYVELLGFRITDVLDHSRMASHPEQIAGLGDPKGYFMRYGSDHHSFVLFPKRLREALKRREPNSEMTTNQISWQVGSLREVVDGNRWFEECGIEMERLGRERTGSNWNIYIPDPEGHTNEIFYGMEQIGWNGHSKPTSKVSQPYTKMPNLPHTSELGEVQEAIAKGVNLVSGHRHVDGLPSNYDVDGILLPRPFKIVRIGPVGLFVRDMEKVMAFYTKVMGLIPTEEVVWQGSRCVFLRANMEHHSLALYPLALRDVLGLSKHTTCMTFGIQLGTYQQLRNAVAYLREHDVKFVGLPTELFPGIDYAAHIMDPDGHVLQLYHHIEQIGWDGKARSPKQKEEIDPDHWPDTLEPCPDSYAGEPFFGPLG